MTDFNALVLPAVTRFNKRAPPGRPPMSHRPPGRWRYRE